MDVEEEEEGRCMKKQKKGRRGHGELGINVFAFFLCPPFLLFTHALTRKGRRCLGEMRNHTAWDGMESHWKVIGSRLGDRNIANCPMRERSKDE